MLRFHSLFSNHAVLQRAVPLPFYGAARSRATISVTFAGETLHTVAEESGDWRVEFPSRKAGGPYELSVESEDEICSRSGIFIGEVWVGSGQSNMDWPLCNSSDWETEIFGARFPEIHLLIVPLRPSLSREADLDASWALCTPATVPLFSAVLYHFARRLLPELNCHIGLIHAAWGGTEALPWASQTAILAEPKLSHAAQQIASVKEIASVAPRDVCREIEMDPLVAEWALADYNHTDWQTMPVPSFWQDQGHLFNGAVWFRHEIEIPKRWAGLQLELKLGMVDDFDTTYFQGTKVGGIGPENSFAYRTPRFYPIPAELVQSGRAVIAVRVFDWMGMGGMVGPASSLRLAPATNPEDFLSLHGLWHYKVERAIPLPTAEDKIQGQSVASALFQGMIAPLVQFPVRGILWYQGEADAPRAALYPVILRTLIAGWRAEWAKAELPFYIVQLPCFQTGSAATDTEWAELREAQAIADVPGVDYITTLDCGDPYDIHPKDKRTVGYRLAALALKELYGKQNVPSCSPRFKRQEKTSAGVKIYFDLVGSALRSADGAAVRGFTMAGADHIFVPAIAEICEFDTLLLSSAEVPEPQFVRYAWGTGCDANLENFEAQPAAPFRTDTLPLLTTGRT